MLREEASTEEHLSGDDVALNLSSPLARSRSIRMLLENTATCRT